MPPRLLSRTPLCRWSTIPIRRLLSPAFALNEAWAERHKDISRLGLGGDYEWIATVQKKFVGGGLASTVDVDAAVCMAEHKDQVEQLLDILRKLRHSPSAARVASSSQYAMLRLLLKHNPEEIVDLAIDPINNGIFPDDHAACLLIDHFIEANDINTAARLAAWMMQQEQFSSLLLNSLSIVASLKWTELKRQERKMKGEGEEEEEVNDEDIVTIKVPFLKNAYDDGHFDLVEGNALVGKTLLWFAREMEGKAPKELTSGCTFLGSLLSSSSPSSILPLLSSSSSSISPSTARSAIAFLDEIAEPTDEQKEIVDKLSSIAGVSSSASGEASSGADATRLSSVAVAYLQTIRADEEKRMMEEQTKRFGEWNERRRKLIEAQAVRLQINIRKAEMAAELAVMEAEDEKLHFFERRLQLERAAKQNEEIAAEAAQMK